MVPRIIKSEADFEAAVQRIDELMSAEAGTPEGDELELLALLVEQYEHEHFPVDLPTPIEAIEFRMDQAGLTRRDLEPYIGSRGKVSEVLSGKRPLSLRMIRALHNRLGIPADILLQEPGARIPDEDPEIDWSRFPVNEMHKRGWFSNFEGTIHDAKEHAEELIRGLLGDYEKRAFLPAMYRRHVRAGVRIDNYGLLAWTARVMALAQESDLPHYRHEVLTGNFMNNLVRLSCFDNGPLLVRDYLAKHGVHLVFERHLLRTRLDGAAMVLPDGNPVVALTLRHDRVDNFWFTLFHEIAHLALHLDGREKELYIDDVDVCDNDQREKEADSWAADMLIPPSVWRELEGKVRQVSKKYILELADTLGIHPGIIAGRIRKETGNYKIFNNLVGHRQVRCLFFTD